MFVNVFELDDLVIVEVFLYYHLDFSVELI